MRRTCLYRTSASLVLGNTSSSSATSDNKPSSDFIYRHIGPQPKEIESMLRTLKYTSMNDFIENVIPKNILLANNPANFAGVSEAESLKSLEQMMGKNQIKVSCLGEGYHNTHMPSVIQRHLLENPGWYTPYTPYQAEISQGRLQSLLNFQTMVTELTKMDICNASLLDEATASAEAAFMCSALQERHPERTAFIVIDSCHPRTIEMIQTRCSARKIDVKVIPFAQLATDADLLKKSCGVLLPYPDTYGHIEVKLNDYIATIKSHGSIAVMSVDVLALTKLKPPGELGADICVGTTQRFGVPMGYGGPHAAFLATTEKYKRSIPGRIIGISKDTMGNPALRMALQTREQHIRRAKASSNICTAQALLANISVMYAIYHGPEGLTAIANRVHQHAVYLYNIALQLGFQKPGASFFDTVSIEFSAPYSAQSFADLAVQENINVRVVDERRAVVAFDETTTESTVNALAACLFCLRKVKEVDAEKIKAQSMLKAELIPSSLIREGQYMTQGVFHDHRSETAMMRYMASLQRKDYNLTTGMIPLGSCTMKLNAASEMIPMSWKSITGLHPFCPSNQAQGYTDMLSILQKNLAQLMGFDDVLLQPNSGAQGEYAGLRVIQAYHADRGQGHRDKCFVLQSAHGTNPASATMAGLIPVEVKCKESGETDLDDLTRLLELHKESISCIMITYPSTYGIFEENIKLICEMVHAVGGQVYIDGANLNAMVGVSSPGSIGGDVAHTNLHKTFAIPHGGGGPGQGPIGVKKHLIPYLPGKDKAFGIVSQAPNGSSSILNISYMYMTMMGSEGLKTATQVAILNANYLRALLAPHYKILFSDGKKGCAHEFILDLRKFKATAGIEAEDVAKRLMDYNFHAPTLSFPIPNTIMVEPTESEPLSELNRFADALISIRNEIREVEEGIMPRETNLLKCAPHTQDVLAQEEWTRPYSRKRAVFPNEFVRQNKFWPTVTRIDGAWGDRNFSCVCSAVNEEGKPE